MSLSNREFAQAEYKRRKDEIKGKVIAETIAKTHGRWNWDYYRRKYLAGEYTFEQLKVLNQWFYELGPKGREHFNRGWIDKFFEEIAYGGMSIHELGCGEGLLAKHCLEKWDEIDFWYGYDLYCPEGFEHGRYESLNLNCQVWEWETWVTNVNSDIFVSSHTIEHLSVAEVKQLVKALDFEYLYIEAPLTEAGKVWRGGGSAHVFREGSAFVKNQIAKKGYRLLDEFREGANWCGMWSTF